ncbi:hypothetical protein [Desulforhopalus singaporensis]|uniref:Uncharacterized protein n=1 Tax=Desulforhopalus singaporensis TaxID=91360 RepID=A0A1H0W1Z4_9BACT|nr:hypothetical protein [Desulforhopalus singaporensis]SDP84719.1 hypothetical protein SAMN05660330_04381 [Desulforhopalus singaporensis]
MIFDYGGALKKLENELNGLKIHSLNFIDYELFAKGENYLIEHIGLSVKNIIRYKVKGQPYGSNHGGAANSNILGCTVTIKLDNLIEQVIFVQKGPPRESKESDEEYNYVKSACNLCALAHELGHVEDILRGAKGNFQLKPEPSVNLLEAEIYAHSYCLNYLHSVKANTARNMVAKGISKAAVAGKVFQKSVLTGVYNNIGKGRVKKWMK